MAEGSGLLNRQGITALTGSNPVPSAKYIKKGEKLCVFLSILILVLLL